MCKHLRIVGDNYGMTCMDCGEVIAGFGYWGNGSQECKHQWLPDPDGKGETCPYCQAYRPIEDDDEQDGSFSLYPPDFLFPTGRVYYTPGVEELIHRGLATMEEVLALVDRHARGDWSEMDGTDQELNRRAIHSAQRIFSAYTLNDRRIWVITEADRSRTTILLPDEY